MSSTIALKESLQRRFDLISNTHTDSDLFLEICNYIDKVVTDERLSAIRMSINIERKKALEAYDALAINAKKLLSDLGKKLQELLLSSNIDDQFVASVFKHFNEIVLGNIITSGEIWQSLESDLREAIWTTLGQYPDAKINDFATVKSDRVYFSESMENLLKKCVEEMSYIKIIRETAVWGAWNNLLIIYQAVYSSDRQWKETFKENPLAGMNFALLVGEMRTILSSKDFSVDSSKRLVFKREQALLDLRRVHNYILDHLDITNIGLALLRKYKQRCEWFSQAELSNLIDSSLQRRKRAHTEEILTKELCTYLHDNNVIPLAQVVFGNSRPDVLGFYSKDELFPIEVKVVKKGENAKIKTGFNQILTYLKTIDLIEGFYVVFCRGDFQLEMPQTIFLDNRQINIITINIFENSPSNRKADIWQLSEKDLVS